MEDPPIDLGLLSVSLHTRELYKANIYLANNMFYIQYNRNDKQKSNMDYGFTIRYCWSENIFSIKSGSTSSNHYSLHKRGCEK